MLPQIAHFFLAASSLSRPGELVLDPFGGTGTVALEALLAGRRAIQADANPLARLIAQTKTRVISEAEMKGALLRVRDRYKLSRRLTPPAVVNIKYWYSSADIRALSRLRAAVLAEEKKYVREFLLVTFSAVTRKASFADLRFSVPVRSKLSGKGEARAETIWQLFEQQYQANVQRQRAFRSLCPTLRPARCAGFDARNLRTPSDWNKVGTKRLKTGSVDLVITSPPYGGAQKYIRASSLSLGWLGLAGRNDLRTFERQNIGREHLSKAESDLVPSTKLVDADRLIRLISERNPRRAAIVATYLAEMREALIETVRVLKPGGHLVLVIGDNHVCGEEFRSSMFLSQILCEAGLTLKLQMFDEIRSRGLITKRHKSAGIITKEWVLLFQKRIDLQ
jgi:hypothetical protein